MNRLEKFELISNICVISIAAIVSLMDFAGVLDNITWLKSRVPTITLLLLAAIAISLLLELYRSKAMLKSVLPLGTFKRYHGSEDLLRDLVRKIKTARIEICDVTMLEFSQTSLLRVEEDYRKLKDAVCSASENTRYREIISLSSSYCAKKALDLVDSSGKHYELSIYNIKVGDCPPVWNFIIIDNELILFAERLLVREKNMVQYYRNYYETLWDSAISIKSGNYANTKPVEAALKQLRKANKTTKSHIIADESLIPN